MSSTRRLCWHIIRRMKNGEHKSKKEDESGKTETETDSEGVSHCRRDFSWNPDPCDTCFHRMYLETWNDSYQTGSRAGSSFVSICSFVVYNAGDYQGEGNRQ